jgi:hypothetical protein
VIFPKTVLVQLTFLLFLITLTYALSYIIFLLLALA